MLSFTGFTLPMSMSVSVCMLSILCASQILHAPRRLKSLKSRLRLGPCNPSSSLHQLISRNHHTSHRRRHPTRPHTTTNTTTTHSLRIRNMPLTPPRPTGSKTIPTRTPHPRLSLTLLLLLLSQQRTPLPCETSFHQPSRRRIHFPKRRFRNERFERT